MLEQVFIILFEQSKQSSKQQVTTKSRSVENLPVNVYMKKMRKL